MAIHSFDSAIAQQVGVNAAIIYQNIQFWVEKNQANNKHFYDGCFWTYNSVKAFSNLFPYLTDRQIRTAIDKLKEANLIKVGNFNKANYDRTNWYSCQIELTLKSNGNDQNVEPIPDSKPDNKQHIDSANALVTQVVEIFNTTKDEYQPNWSKCEALTKSRTTLIKNRIKDVEKRIKETDHTVETWFTAFLAKAANDQFYSGKPKFNGDTGYKWSIDNLLREKNFVQAIERLNDE